MTLTEYANKWLKDKGMSSSEAKKKAGNYKSIAAAKRAGSLYYKDKNGKTQLAVYAEDLKDTGPLRPKLRPDSGSSSTKDTPKVYSGRSRVTPNEDSKKTDNKTAVKKGGKTVAEIKKMAEEAIKSAEVSEARKKRIKKHMKDIEQETADDPTTYLDNITRYIRNTLRGGGLSNRKRKDPRKMYKGGMAKKKSGYAAGGSVRPRTGHTDHRSKGLFK